MKLKIAFILLSFLFLSGCSWWKYKFPQEQDFQAVNHRSDSYLLGVQNFGSSDLSQKRLESVRSALSDVQDIFQHSKEFEKIITGKNWVSSCDGKEIEKVSGEELLDDLRKLSLKVSVFPKKPWMAIGLTDTANNRIAIDPSRIDSATDDELIDASWLVETTAHEITHILLDVNAMVKYRDRGHGKAGCSKNELASYRVGKTAQAVWIHDKVSE